MPNVKPISDKRTQNQLFLKEYLTDPRKEVKLKTQTILNTLGVKIRDSTVSSNNTVPAKDDNFGGSTGLAKTMQGSADMCTFIPGTKRSFLWGGRGVIGQSIFFGVQQIY